MKIAIFSAQFLPHMGGVENYTYHLAKKMIAEGHQVFVITCNLGGWDRIADFDGILVYRFDAFDFIQGRYPIAKKNRANAKLKKEINRLEFDYVIVNTRFYLHSLYGVNFARKKHIPCMVIEHGTAHLSVNVKLLDVIGAAYEHALTYLVKKKCDTFYAVSKNSGKWLEHFHIHAQGVLYNAVADDEIEAIIQEKKEAVKTKLHIPKQDRVITFTGRLVQEKGILQLLAAFQAVLPKHLHLCIAGEGILENTAQAYAGAQIHLLGRLSFKEVIALLSESDYFILPSDSEGFSTSVLEAGICECYIISSDVGGIREVILDDTYGMILPNNRKEDIARALSALPNLKEEDYRKAIQLTKERIKTHFTWEITYRKIMEIIQNQTS